jgi:hypothetical protein
MVVFCQTSGQVSALMLNSVKIGRLTYRCSLICVGCHAILAIFVSLSLLTPNRTSVKSLMKIQGKIGHGRISEGTGAFHSLLQLEVALGLM